VGQATVAQPTGSPLVPADAGANLRTYIIRLARTVNEAMRGNISATLQVTLVANDTSSTFSDTRIGPWTAISLVPLTPHAADLLPYVSLSTPVKGTAVINHARTTYTDCTYLACLIGT
jgi:hypothetical protein